MTNILPIVLNFKLIFIFYIFLPDIWQFYEVDDLVWLECATFINIISPTVGE